MNPSSRPSPLSREAIAHVEVGQTNLSPRLARAIVGGFLLAVVLLPAAEFLGERAAGDRAADPVARLAAIGPDARLRVEALGPDAPAWSRLVAANRAVLAGLTAFEADLEDGSAVGRWLRPPTQLVLSTALGAGNERVYVGRDRWLFFRPDVEYVTGPGFLEPRVLARRIAAADEFVTPPAPDPRPAILAFARDLEARGVVLVLVPTPVKPTVHPGELSRRFDDVRTPVQNVSYGAWLDAMEAAGVRVFDPGPLLAGWRASEGTPQYLATDTHWRPEAMQRVAATLADYLRRELGLPGVDSPAFRVARREARAPGDTLVALDLPAWQSRRRPETVPLAYVMDAAGDPWRPSPDADVLLLGDSFTNIFSLASMGWGEAAGFAEHLSLALDRPVDRIVQNDAGARATRDQLVRELAASRGSGDAFDRLTTKRVVVWQFATRELASGDWAVLPLPR